MNLVLKSVRFINKINTQTRSVYTGIDLKNYRSLISIKGADSSVYLQNLITNNVYNLNNQKQSMYAMMLNNRGRMLYDVLVYKLNDEYLVELDSRYVNDALKLMKMFKIKKKVDLNQADSEYKLYSLFDHDQSELKLNDEYKNDVLIINKDPRYSGLGHRIILKPNSHKINDYFNNVIDLTSDLKLYKKNLYKNGIHENNDEFKPGSSVPLEYNLVYLNGVSFDKGCYLGQELVAKTHHTGVIRKRIMPIKLINRVEQEIEFSQDNLIINTKTAATVGKLKGLIDQDGIAMLRLANLDKESLVLLDNNKKEHKIKFSIPNYWPLDDRHLSDLKQFL